MTSLFKKQTSELRKVLDSLDEFYIQVEQVAKKLREIFERGGIVYVAGNGGSAAQAQHFSDEMVGRYKGDRVPYPVVALTADSAVLTCIGNDFGYEYIFRRQIQALGREGDAFVGLSTSGASKNVLVAAKQARDSGMTVIAFTGGAGLLKDMADYAIVVPSESTARIQELHLHAIHLICESLEGDDSATRSRAG